MPLGVGWHSGFDARRELCSAKGLYESSQVSNEPGLYLEGCLGIRIENLMLVVQKAGRSQTSLTPSRVLAAGCWQRWQKLLGPPSDYLGPDSVARERKQDFC